MPIDLLVGLNLSLQLFMYNCLK